MNRLRDVEKNLLNHQNMIKTVPTVHLPLEFVKPLLVNHLLLCEEKHHQLLPHHRERLLLSDKRNPHQCPLNIHEARVQKRNHPYQNMNLLKNNVQRKNLSVLRVIAIQIPIAMEVHPLLLHQQRKDYRDLPYKLRKSESLPVHLRVIVSVLRVSHQLFQLKDVEK